MSIWKTPDQKPDLYKILAIKTNKGNAYTNILTNEKDWNPILLPSFYNIDDIDKAERITLYAYLDDLIAQADKAERLQNALCFIRNIRGAGMSYQDMFLDAHEVAKTALDPEHKPVLCGRYDEEYFKTAENRIKGGEE